MSDQVATRRLTPRDAQALAWLEGQYAIWEADVGHLLGRLDGKPPPSLPGVQRVLRRWQDLGYVHVDRLPGTARLAWLVRNRPRELGWSKLAHAAAESRARLWLEQVPGNTWIGEFELQPLGLRSKAAVLDGMLLVGEELTRVGLEVELSAKSLYRVRERLRRLQTEPHLAAVLYLVDGDGGRPIRKVLEETQDELRARADAHGVPHRGPKVLAHRMPSSPADPLPDAVKEFLTCTPKA